MKIIAIIISTISYWLISNINHQLNREKNKKPIISLLAICQIQPERIKRDIGIVKINLYKDFLIIMHFSQHFKLANESRDYKTGLYSLIHRLSRNMIKKGRFAHEVNKENIISMSTLNKNKIIISYLDDQNIKYNLTIKPEIFQKKKFVKFKKEIFKALDQKNN